jgi:YVTN family beta-propeller protein
MKISALVIMAAVALFVPSTSAPVATGADEGYKVVGTIPLPFRPGAIAVNPDTDRLYVAIDKVYVVDTAVQQVIETISVPSSADIAVNRVTNTIYNVDYSGNVEVIDGETNEQIALITVFTDDATAIAVDSVQNRIYVNDGNSEIAVIDGVTNAVIDHLSPHAGRMAVDTEARKLYVVPRPLDVEATLTVWDLTGRAKRETDLGVAPFDVAIDSESGAAFVARGINDAVGPGELLVVDPVDLAIEQATPLETQIWQIAVDPVAHVVYATNFYPSTVTVFDSAGNVLATVSVGQGPFNVAVDEKRHLAYVTHGNDSSIAVIGSGASELPSGGGPPAPAPNAHTAAFLTVAFALLTLGVSLVLASRRMS